MHPKICLSLGNISYNEALQHIDNVSLAEIRMELLRFTDSQLSAVFHRGKRTIATYRHGNSPDTLLPKYSWAIEQGCEYIDVQYNMPNTYRNRLVELAHSRGCKVILSYHNYQETPAGEDLSRLIGEMGSAGADIVKLACTANSPTDCARVLGLYENHSGLVAFCMGETGRATRLIAPMLGAPFTYASVKGKEVAPGQMCYGEVEHFLEMLEMSGK